MPGDRTQNNRPDTVIPLSTEMLDMAAYTFIYHMEQYGCALENDPFWGYINVHELLLKYKLEECSASHSMSCFKNGCACRFLFHLCQLTVHTFMRIEVRRMKKNIVVFTRWIMKEDLSLYCSAKQTHGLPVHESTQFINLEVFDFNTNIRIGDVSQVFYSTLYTSKSTQEEDRWIFFPGSTLQYHLHHLGHM